MINSAIVWRNDIDDIFGVFAYDSDTTSASQTLRKAVERKMLSLFDVGDSLTVITEDDGLEYENAINYLSPDSLNYTYSFNSSGTIYVGE